MLPFAAVSGALRPDEMMETPNVAPFAPASASSSLSSVAVEVVHADKAPAPSKSNVGAHSLKHKRAKVPIDALDEPLAAGSGPPPQPPSPRSTVGSLSLDAISATTLLAQIQAMPFSPSVASDIAVDPADLAQHRTIVRDIRQHIAVLKDSLPTYRDVLEDVGVVLCTTLSRTITRSEAAIAKVKEALHAETMEKDTQAIRAQIQQLVATAETNAAKFAEFELWRKTRLESEQKHMASVRAGIGTAKADMESRLLELAQANERIAALYQRHIEARRFVNSVADIKEQEAQLMTDIEALSDHKNSLMEQLLDLRQSHSAAMHALATEKAELEGVIFQIKTKLGTVTRKADVVRAELGKKQAELRAQTQGNAGLRQAQQQWQEKLSARQALEWRAKTPRPAHADAHGLLRHVDVSKGATSTAIVDAGLKKLAVLTASSKKQFDELMRLSRVIRPLSSIVLHAQVDPTHGFRDHESDHIIITPSIDLMSYVSFAEHPVNERWSQAMTERHAVAMFKVLPIMPITSNSPQNRVNEAMTKWCMSPEYSAPSFPPNFILSLRAYARVSAICRAGLLTLHAKLPLGFGDGVLHFFAQATQAKDPSVPLRTLQAQVAKAVMRDGSCLGTFFALQLKLAASLDAASNGSNVKITALSDISDAKRNSALLLRTVFAHMLQQDQTIRQAIWAAAMASTRSSLTNMRDVLVHEPTFRAKLEALRWDPETFHGSGVRYGPTQRLVALNAKVMLEGLLAGLPKVDGALHRIDEAAHAAAGSAASGSGKQAGGGRGKAGKEDATPAGGGARGIKEYLLVEPLFAALSVAPIKTIDTKVNE